MEAAPGILLDKLESMIEHMPKEILLSLPTRPEQKNETSFRLIFSERGEVPILSGAGDGKVRVINLKQGSVVIGYPGGPSSIARHAECGTFVVAFFPEYIRIVSYDFHQDGTFSDSGYRNFSRKLPPYGYALFNLLKQFRPGNADGNAAGHCVRAILALTLAVLRDGKENPAISKSLYTWSRIDNYISEHLFEDLSRSATSRRFRMNPSYLSTLCQKSTGCCFNEYVRDLRLARATMLLELDLSLDEIAQECGFAYTSYFIRAFKEKYSLSPGKYRETRIKQH